MTRVALLTLGIVTGIALVPPDVAAQGCAMCKTALTDDPVAQAFSWGVLLLMTAPYAVFGLVGGYLFVSHRRAVGDQPTAPVIDLGRVATHPHAHPQEGDQS